MRKRAIICILLVFAVAASGFAEIKITGSAPTFKGNDPTTNAVANALNAELVSAFDNLITSLNNELSNLEIDSPKNFITAWGNAGVFASHGATPRAYGGFRLVNASIGLMVGVQLPFGIGQLFNGEGIFDDLTEDGFDIPLGINPQMFNAQASLNLNTILPLFPKGLYVGARFGVFKLENPFGIDGFSYDSGSFGFTANYQLVPKFSLAKIIEWRGLSVGTGFLYQHTNVGLSLPLGDTITADVGVAGIDGKLEIEPTVIVDFNINTVTIPLEIMTALKLVFINIPAGVGVDIAFGGSELKVGVDAPIRYIGDLGSGITKDKDGSLTVTAGDKFRPKALNLKLMTGLGFTFGPVYLDIPITFYIGNGYNFGITMGVSL